MFHKSVFWVLAYFSKIPGFDLTGVSIMLFWTDLDYDTFFLDYKISVWQLLYVSKLDILMHALWRKCFFEY
ncbi:MAG: hypothetical protein JXR10_07235 [Cyclobacteriaceae bacterium]